ncbi:MAG: hypothetical protein V3V02_06310 [Rhizobiaceae bacterium]
MANLFVPITCLALLGGSLVYGDAKLENAKPHTEATVVEAQFAKTWLLTNDVTHDVCIVTKMRNVTINTSSVEIDPTCDGVIAASSYISVWQQDDKGNVTLGDDQGNAIVEFTFDEALGLISAKGSQEKLSLTPNA